MCLEPPTPAACRLNGIMIAGHCYPSGATGLLFHPGLSEVFSICRKQVHHMHAKSTVVPQFGWLVGQFGALPGTRCSWQQPQFSIAWQLKLAVCFFCNLLGGK